MLTTGVTRHLSRVTDGNYRGNKGNRWQLQGVVRVIETSMATLWGKVERNKNYSFKKD